MTNTSQSVEKWILYSTCDEDSTSELRSLMIKNSDNILCVTGSGCRTLSLVSENPTRITSIDYSPGQSYLLELKYAAMRNLSYDQLLAFFGIDQSSTRWEMFLGFEQQLTSKASAYFQANRWAIDQGILFAGRHERFYIRFVAPLLKILYGKRIEKLFSATSLSEQKDIYWNKIRGPLWKMLIVKGFSERAFKYILNDPQYKIEVDVAHAGEYILDRIDFTFSHHLARSNHWASIMLNGRYLSRYALPHFLLEENYTKIRQAQTQLNIINANLLNYIKTVPPCSIDKFSLSDVTSCITQDEMNILFGEIHRTGRNESIMCLRNFLAKKTIPPELRSKLIRDNETSNLLDLEDTSFDSFEVATITGH